MNLEQLIYANELANHQTIQETTDLLHITKSGLSQAISQLEAEMGVRLFDRSRHGTKLTKDGRTLLPLIKRMLDVNLDLMHYSQTLRVNSQVETVRLAYTNTMLKPILEEYLNLYEKLGDQVNLSIYQYPQDVLIEKVRHHELAAGFIPLNQAGKALIKDLTFTKVADSELKLIVSPENPLVEKKTLTIDDLRSQRFALFNDTANEQIFRHLQFLCGPLKVILNLDSAWSMYSTITKLNAVCLGRTFQLRHADYAPLAQLPEISLSNLIDSRFEFGWLTNPADQLSPTATELIERINARLKQ